MKVQKLILLVLILFVINLVACSENKSEQSTPAESVAKTACDLLNEDDVSAVIGQKGAEVGHYGVGHYTDYDCNYTISAEPVRRVFFRITMPVHETPEQAQTRHIQTAKEGLGEDANTYKYNPVPDVGDLAITEEFLGSNDSVVLVVFKSITEQGKDATVTFTVQLVGFEKEKATQYAKALALNALQHF